MIFVEIVGRGVKQKSNSSLGESCTNLQNQRFCLTSWGDMAKATGSANVDPMSKGGVEKSTGFNPRLIVLIVVVGALLIFGAGNFLLYQYAQRNAPPKKKKPMSKKKLKKERLKGGVRPAGD